MKIAVLLLTCKGTARRTHFSKSWFEALCDVVRRYYIAQSGNRLTMDFTVYDWLELSLTFSDWMAQGFAVGDTARKEASDHYGFTESQFDRFVLVIDDQTSGLGVTPYKTDTLMAAIDASPALFAHELGHGIGATHTKLETPEGPVEYGGPFCIMGAEGGKYSFDEDQLRQPGSGAQTRNVWTGPGMCLVNLCRIGWLDPKTQCAQLIPFQNGSIAGTVRIAALDGAVVGGSATQVGCVVETYDRFFIEYRRPDVFWDSGLATRAPSPQGWLVVYRTPTDGSLDPYQVATLKVDVGASVRIDDAPDFPKLDWLSSAGGPLVSVISVDAPSRTVTLRVERTMVHAPQHFPGNLGVDDPGEWPIARRPPPHRDEPIDQLTIEVARLRELRRLARLTGARQGLTLAEEIKAQTLRLKGTINQMEL